MFLGYWAFGYQMLQEKELRILCFEFVSNLVSGFGFIMKLLDGKVKLDLFLFPAKPKTFKAIII